MRVGWANRLNAQAEDGIAAETDGLPNIEVPRTGILPVFFSSLSIFDCFYRASITFDCGAEFRKRVLLFHSLEKPVQTLAQNLYNISARATQPPRIISCSHSPHATMPGPSSPARQRKRAMTKQKAKQPPPPAPPPFYPSSTSPVLTLPGSLTKDEIIWWNDDLGRKFLDRMKQRGSKNGAKAWVRRRFCGPWWDEHRSNVDVSMEEKLWYFDKTSIGKVSRYLHYIIRIGR